MDRGRAVCLSTCIFQTHYHSDQCDRQRDGRARDGRRKPTGRKGGKDEEPRVENREAEMKTAKGAGVGGRGCTRVRFIIAAFLWRGGWGGGVMGEARAECGSVKYSEGDQEDKQ